MSKDNPLVEFPNEAARRAVVETNSASFVAHATAERAHLARAAALRDEIQRKLTQIHTLQNDVAQLEREAAQEEHHAGEQRALAEGFAQLLVRIGAELPPLPPDPAPGVQVWPAPADAGTQPLQPIEAQARDGLTRPLDIPPDADQLQQRVDRLMAPPPGEPRNPVWDPVEKGPNQ